MLTFPHSASSGIANLNVLRIDGSNRPGYMRSICLRRWRSMGGADGLEEVDEAGAAGDVKCVAGCEDGRHFKVKLLQDERE